ncbi:CBS domain-containing protein [Methanolobus bombayensis]|uniref:CBS domain-containing protein n=1 Tax=Methanolobus bombayensis TaxID=38023 RepID=UPI001AE294DD|nr:CBS domain-containing protein [Methanolobus bombayensis]MBP1907920.1 CBS domain-containing protein [Methanolobus bombayensis]
MTETGKGIPEKTEIQEEEEVPRNRTRLSDICADISVSSIMSKEMTVVRETESIENIIELMTKTPYHSYPVLNSDEELIGVIDEDNILELLFFKRSNRHHHTHLMAIKALSEEASTLMVHHPMTISPETSLCEAADLMIKHHIERLCVVRDKKLEGVVSKSDLIRKIYELRRQ